MRNKIFLVLIMVVAVLLFSSCGKGDKQTAAVPLINSKIYKLADKASKGFTWIKRGEEVTILEKSENKLWLKVELSDGETKGWALADRFFIGKKRPITITEDSDWYRRPDKQSYKKKKKLRQGDKALIIKEMKNGWYKINTGFGSWKEGWIQGNIFERGFVDIKVDQSEKVFKVGTVVGQCEVKVSSWLKNKSQYEPPKMFDGKLDTSWQEGKDDYGIGEWIEISFPLENSYSISLVNGFVKNTKKYGNLYTKNSRVKKVKVLYGEGLQEQVEVDLEDNRMDFQSLGNFKTSKIKIIIMEVYPGEKWKDTSISELKIGTVQ